MPSLPSIAVRAPDFRPEVKPLTSLVADTFAGYKSNMESTLRYNYRIEPEDQQVRRRALRCLGTCWKVANLMIGRCFDDQRDKGRIDLSEAYAWATRDVKKTKELSWIAKTSAVALQQAGNDVRTAFKKWFAKEADRPRFRKYTDPRSARFVGTAFKVQGERLYLANVGLLKIRLSRPLPSIPSSVTLIQETDGTLHVSFVVTVNEVPLEKTGVDCGVDVGITRFVTIASADLDDGVSVRYIENLKSLTLKAEKRQYVLEKRLARKSGPDRKKKKRASKNWKKVRRQLSKIQLKQRRIRQDVVHQIANTITRDADQIVLETLNVKAMTRRTKTGSRKRLGRSIQRNPIGGLHRAVEQKAVRRGRELLRADRFFPSSKTCCFCHEVFQGLGRGDATWICPSCNAHHDRDGNAAVALLHLTGRMAVPRDTRELMPCSPHPRRSPSSHDDGPRTRLRASVSTGVGPLHGEGTLRGDAQGSSS